MRSAAFYGRFSCEKQNEQSIEGQLRICQQFAVQNDLNIVETYIDRATTGTNDNRVAFQQMLADSAKPVMWDVVLVYAIDRFGRNSIEVAVNKQKLKKNKKILISATQRTSDNLDGSKNLDGILLENVYIGLAEYYSAELSQKTTRGMKENRLKGLFCGGKVPYGYKVVNKRVLINEDEAEIVRHIFKEYAAGKVAREIIDELNAKGIKRSGKPFAMNSLYNLLRFENYIGIYRHNEEVYYETYPAIVSKELFEEVGYIIAKNKRGSRSAHIEYLLRGKIYCGYCGKKMHGESGTSKSGKTMYYYKCSGKKRGLPCESPILPKERIEDIVIDATLRVMSNRGNLELIADAVMRVHEKRIHDKSIMSILINERDSIQKSLSNVMKAIESGILTATTKARMEELEEQLEQAKSKILVEENRTKNQLTKEQVIEFLSHAVQKQPSLMINLLVQKVVVYQDKLEIYYNYVPNTAPDDPDEERDISSDRCSGLFDLRSPNASQVAPSKGATCDFAGEASEPQVAPKVRVHILPYGFALVAKIG